MKNLGFLCFDIKLINDMIGVYPNEKLYDQSFYS